MHHRVPYRIICPLGIDRDGTQAAPIELNRPRLNSIGADWIQSGARLKIEDSRENIPRNLQSSIRAPIELNRPRLNSIGPGWNSPNHQMVHRLAPPLKIYIQFSYAGALKYTKRGSREGYRIYTLCLFFIIYRNIFMNHWIDSIS